VAYLCKGRGVCLGCNTFPGARFLTAVLFLWILNFFFIRVWVYIGLWIGIQIWSSFFDKGSHVAYQAHIGGIALGLFFAVVHKILNRGGKLL